MAAGHAGRNVAVVKERERPGRGCACCPDYPRKESKKRSRQVARRTARQSLRMDR